jgi:hypothetical protein
VRGQHVGTIQRGLKEISGKGGDVAGKLHRSMLKQQVHAAGAARCNSSRCRREKDEASNGRPRFLGDMWWTASHRKRRRVLRST